jgi:hypothetical protein
MHKTEKIIRKQISKQAHGMRPQLHRRIPQLLQQGTSGNNKGCRKKHHLHYFAQLIPGT